ncbi:DUF86 domain-containing protein [bacterium]|nr:DUF86 domain-containing protein [bacterium]
MNVSDRDAGILIHIIDYCDQIDETIERFGQDQKLFLEDKVYHNAIALCILQIGELVGILSDDFRSGHSEIPWREIKLMRNIVAHRYGTVDHTITWEVILNDIPNLKIFCKQILSSYKK